VLAPVSYAAVHRLIQLDLKTYLWQYVPPLIASFGMVAVIMGLKYLLKDQSLNLYLELTLYLLAGGLTYLVIIGLIARQLYQQILELVSVVLPKLKFRKA